MNDTPKRPHFRYSLRTLLVVVTIACAAFGWLGVKVRVKQREREAVKAIRESGAEVQYDYEVSLDGNAPKPPAPEWLRKLVGDDFFANIIVVSFGRATIDADLRQLLGLKQLRRLELSGSEVTDGGVVHLQALPQLQYLDLSETQVTDAALDHIKLLKQLERLDLGRTLVTGMALPHLKGLTKLKTLMLFETEVTDAEVAELQKALPNLKIYR